MNRCHKELSLATRELSSSLFTILTMYYATVDVSWWSPCKPAMGVTGKWWFDNDSPRSAGSRILYTIWGEIFEDNKYKIPFVILYLIMLYGILCSVEWCSDWGWPVGNYPGNWMARWKPWKNKLASPRYEAGVMITLQWHLVYQPLTLICLHSCLTLVSTKYECH